MLVKKELSTLPLLPIPKIKAKKGMERRFTMAVSTVDLPKSGKILVADFYERHSKQLKARFFSDAKNFTCCTEWPVQCWTERNPRKVLGDWNADCADGDTETCATFFGARRSYYCSEALGIIDGFCCDVQAEYRNRREAAKLLLQKEHFAMFPALPKDLREYCEEHVFDHGYIFFSAQDKRGKRDGFCSRCGKHFGVEPGIRSGRMAFCPKCGKPVRYRAAWIKSDIVDSDKLCVTANVDGQLLIRWMNVERYFRWPDFKMTYSFDDYAYNLHLNTKQGPKTYFYKWLKGPFCYGYGWYRGKIGDYCYDKSYVYTPNLDAVFGSNYYHCDLKAILSRFNARVPFAKLLNNLKNTPAAEYLFKLGMPSLAASAEYLALPDAARANSFSGVLGVSKQMMDLYSSMNVSLHEHRIIQAYGKWVSKEDLAAYRALGDLTGAQSEVIEVLNTMSIGKFVHYFSKQKAIRPKESIKHIVIQYRDYIDMSIGLNVDLSHKSVRFPRDCMDAHSQILPRFNQVKHAAEDTLFAEKVKPLYAKLRITEFEKNGFCIVLPRLRSDLITEGQSLNHCVGGDGYYHNHIAGTKMIFFVRRSEAPEKPYFTLEVDMGTFRINQLYGFGDCSAPKAVRQFAQDFVNRLSGKTVQRRTA